MTVLEWDRVGERFYQTGVDRGVLYLKDGTAVPWNGITGVEEGSDSDRKSFYIDGVKYLESVTPGDFSGKLKAFTYPDAFERALGIQRIASGLSYYEQPPEYFNLSYRSKVGNDLTEDYGYKIHLFYNLLAVQESFTRDSIRNPVTPSEFSWSISGTPPRIAGFRPTSHIAIDSNDVPEDVFQAIENILYGTEFTAARFPSIEEITSLFGESHRLVITDNGDGTWSATDQSGDYISMLNDTTFQIDGANALYLDPDTYIISDTEMASADLPMSSPDGGVWTVIVTDDGTFDISSGGGSGDEPSASLLLVSPDETVWEITVANDGTFTVSPADPGSIGEFEFRFESDNGTIWAVTVTNDGTLDVAAS